MMRIITGRARGTKLDAPKGEKTRPTAERTKEAVFSMLQFEIAGTEVLDLFAGSGQMALEALSRGASHALLCDASRDAVEVIRRNAEKTRMTELCEIRCSDFEALLMSVRGRRTFDLVFLDPPYALGCLPRALRRLVEGRLLKNGAKLVCESADPADVFAGDAALAKEFEILKTTHYGVASVTLLQYKDNREEEML